MISTTKMMFAGIVGMGMAMSVAAQTMSTPAAGEGKPAKADTKFMQEAASGGMAEVEMGKLAEQKATNDQVKQFGAKMAQDHSKAGDELKQIASSKGVQLPTSIDKKQQKEMDKLQKLSGADFDRDYMSYMVSDHKKDISDFKKEANSGKDSDVKSFAAKTLPTLQEHLQLAQAANDAAKKSK